MDPIARRQFNQAFDESRYRQFLATIENDFPGQLEFRAAETPVFIDRSFQEKLTGACEGIVDVIRSADFLEKTARAIPEGQEVPDENAHTSFLAIDFAVCRGETGELTPQLIELQGFPSVFAYQGYLSELFRKFYDLAPNWHYARTEEPGTEEADRYIHALRELIIGKEDPDNVILLELFPEQQKTRIDFAITEKYLGLRTVCYTRLVREGRKLYYFLEGRKIAVKRIYNRLIFDDLARYPDLKTSFQFSDPVDVTWVGHPNWFFRISKFLLPYLSGPCIPETRFVSDFKGDFPRDLENYVLKPLFSFAGSGVELHVTQEMLRKLAQPENYILQRKVTYEPVIADPEGGQVKAEIRMLYTWPERSDRPVWLTALSRLSRGEMIGVRYNKDKNWVGSSAVFFDH